MGQDRKARSRDRQGTRAGFPVGNVASLVLLLTTLSAGGAGCFSVPRPLPFDPDGANDDREDPAEADGREDPGQTESPEDPGQTEGPGDADGETDVPEPPAETCDGVDNDLDGAVDDGVCTTILARVRYWPVNEYTDPALAERNHALMIDCQDFRNDGCWPSSLGSTGCTTDQCTDGGERCIVGFSQYGTYEVEHQFTGLEPGSSHCLCYCQGHNTYTWGATLSVMDGAGGWHDVATGTDVRSINWLCSCDVVPQRP